MTDLLSGFVDIRREHREPISRQLLMQMRAAILVGRLPCGFRLPSSRDLARRLNVSRNTVSAVVEQLAMEGYLSVSRGRRPIVGATGTSRFPHREALPKRPVGAPRLSRWGERLRCVDWPFTEQGPPRPFAPGIADWRAFPHDLWARCLRRAARRATGSASGMLNRQSLQKALLTHLAGHRGVRAEARQLIIVPSAQSAIEIIARVMLERDEIAWLESPGYGGAAAALDAAGAQIRGVMLDGSGLCFQSRTDRPRLIFVTPSHQYPTGRLMTIARRQELLRFAAHVGAVIVEDDYDSEFHYDGRPIAALQGLDNDGCVFYVGTFSKSMFADVRVGYVVVPPGLVELFERAQRHAGLIAAAPLQEALSLFIEAGHFAAHIRKMARIYRGRRNRLVEALVASAGDHMRVVPPPGGMQLLAHLERSRDDRAIVADLAAAGVTARPLSRHFIGEADAQGLFLGFAAWTDREIDRAAATVGKVLGRSRRML